VPKPKFLPTFIQGGYYTPDQLADFLLAACKETAESPPFETEAKKALTRAINRLRQPKSRFDDTLYMVARVFQQRTGCADSTALKKAAGKRWRTLHNELKKRRLTLAQRVKNTPHKF
jgi:hypothetical protein